MENNPDVVHENLIVALRPRLCLYIDVDQVLDRIHFISREEAERVRQVKTNDGNSAAVKVLLDAVVKKPHPDRWFQTFVVALRDAKLDAAANYLQVKLPDPELEAENDQCVWLIELLVPTLVDMNTPAVAMHCGSYGLLTPEDDERITAETRNHGNRAGARELLKRIVRRPWGWFSDFQTALLKTEHRQLYEQTGGSLDSNLTPTNKKEKESSSETKETDEAETSTEKSVESVKVDDNTDLYTAECADSSEASGPGGAAAPSLPPGGRPKSASDGPESGGASGAAPGGPSGGGPERTPIKLRPYQMEVAQPALEGHNIIICLPTGSGKTRVAVYIAKTHLDARKAGGRPGKVVVLVNKIPLVEQHFTKEFSLLKPDYRVERVSGDSQLKISFTEVMEKYDVVICTAQILENYLERAVSGEDDGVYLKDVTLMIIDECHHTQKGGVYNHIMMRYLKQKQKNMKLNAPAPLPQVLGLTASPGVGGATKIDKAKDHILRICANLDALRIMTAEVGELEKDTIFVAAEDRKKDPFGDVIKNIMNAIHVYAELNPTCELGSQVYEQWAVQKEQQAAKEEDPKVRVCAEHLVHYNEGLHLSNSIRMCDALSFLNKYNEEARKKKMSPDDDHQIQITPTERFLFNLFKDSKKELQTLAKNPLFENDSLSKLKATVLREFTARKEPRAIIFITTRRSAIALSQWIQDNPEFAQVGVRAAHVIGAGSQSVVKPMTSAEQDDVLNRFRSGKINLLVSTALAEEGLDIPQCNVVISYGHATNEIGMIQAKGRGRAEDSSYIVVEVKGSGVGEKQSVNEYRQGLMKKAIDRIKNLSQAEYNKKIREFQLQSIMENKVRVKKSKQEKVKQKPGDLKLFCRHCNKFVCTGEDINIVENMHRVNVSSEFKELFIETANTTLQERQLDCEASGFISCRDCGQRWGSMMQYRGINCPCLHVKNFVIEISGKRNSKCTKWSEVTVKLAAFDYIGYANSMAHGSDEEDTE